MGAEQYGDDAYLEKDMFKEAFDELIDFMNYMELQMRKEGDEYRRAEIARLRMGAAVLLWRATKIAYPKITLPTTENYDETN